MQEFSVEASGMAPQKQNSNEQQGGWWSNGVAGAAPSGQGDIVSSRVDSVAQQYGQITPPDSAKLSAETANAEEADAVKRKERARNAANKRHAKSKAKSADEESLTTPGTEVATEEKGERQAHYREKNRIAAAKCRAKKKDHNDNLEEIHRDEASKNKILKAELMGLRNELAQLRTLTLEHGPDSCNCHGIHEYSMRQADLIARGAAPQYGGTTHSPHHGSVSTPQSDGSDDRRFSMQNQAMSHGMHDHSHPSPSYMSNPWMKPL